MKLSTYVIMLRMDVSTFDERRSRLGALMKQRRLELDLSKRSVSDKAGVSINTYGRIEDGHPVRDISYSKIESVLGWPPGSAQEILAGSHESVDGVGGGVVAATIPEDALTDSVQRAFVAVTDDLTAAQIRELSDRVVEDLKKRGHL